MREKKGRILPSNRNDSVWTLNKQYIHYMKLLLWTSLLLLFVLRWFLLGTSDVDWIFGHCNCSWVALSKCTFFFLS